MKFDTNKKIKICQIGAGLIGRERILALTKLIDTGKAIELCAIYDPYLNKNDSFLKEHKLKLVDSIDELFAEKPDWIFISTPHDIAVEITKQSLAQGCYILLEKPLGRNLKEAEDIVSHQIKKDQLYVGFNYRFYDGINMALQDIYNNKFGNIISINMLLGHGGGPKDKNSWKLDPIKAGGGVLIDPGIHLLDICKLIFPNEIKIRDVITWKGLWGTGIEEEATILMQSNKSIINLQLSIVKWRSTFRIEINGDQGYGIVEGRGRSYGLQRYIRGKKWGWMFGKSQRETEEVVVETEGNDSFQKEISALLFEEYQGDIRPCNGNEALVDMKMLDQCRTKAEIKNK